MEKFPLFSIYPDYNECKDKGVWIMKKRTIKILSVLCALVMLVTFLPAALSEEVTETVQDTPELTEVATSDEPAGEEPAPAATEEEQPASAVEEEQPAPTTEE